jgi:hypothetical protein
MPAFRIPVLLLVLNLAFGSSTFAAKGVIATGREDPRLASFDRLKTTFVEKHGVPAATPRAILPH